MTKINEKIERGGTVADDVLVVLDDCGDSAGRNDDGTWWTRYSDPDDGLRNASELWAEVHKFLAYPLTVLAVREPEPERKLIGPAHAHLDRPCTDKCYEPLPEGGASWRTAREGDTPGELTPEFDAPPFLDLVRQYGDAREEYAEILRTRSNEEGLDRYATPVNALFERIAALVPPSAPDFLASINKLTIERDEARADLAESRGHAHAMAATADRFHAAILRAEEAREHADHELMSALGVDRLDLVLPAIERLKEAGAERDQLMEALEGFTADREYLRAEVERLKDRVGDLVLTVQQAEQAADEWASTARHRGVELASAQQMLDVATRQSDPSVLSLPKVPTGTVALIGGKTGAQYRAAVDGSWVHQDEDFDDMGQPFLEVLEAEGSVTVVMREPRTKLPCGHLIESNKFEDSEGDMVLITVPPSRDSNGDAVTTPLAWCAQEHGWVGLTNEEYAELTEVFADEPGGTA